MYRDDASAREVRELRYRALQAHVELEISPVWPGCVHEAHVVAPRGARGDAANGSH